MSSSIAVMARRRSAAVVCASICACHSTSGRPLPAPAEKIPTSAPTASTATASSNEVCEVPTQHADTKWVNGQLAIGTIQGIELSWIPFAQLETMRVGTALHIAVRVYAFSERLRAPSLVSARWCRLIESPKESVTVAIWGAGASAKLSVASNVRKALVRCLSNPDLVVADSATLGVAPTRLFVAINFAPGDALLAPVKELAATPSSFGPVAEGDPLYETIGSLTCSNSERVRVFQLEGVFP